MHKPKISQNNETFLRTSNLTSRPNETEQLFELDQLAQPHDFKIFASFMKIGMGVV